MSKKKQLNLLISYLYDKKLLLFSFQFLYLNPFSTLILHVVSIIASYTLPSLEHLPS